MRRDTRTAEQRRGSNNAARRSRPTARGSTRTTSCTSYDGALVESLCRMIFINSWFGPIQVSPSSVRPPVASPRPRRPSV